MEHTIGKSIGELHGDALIFCYYPLKHFITLSLVIEVAYGT
jgi:hypothetical protein